MTSMKISKKWRMMGEIYARFCPKYECYDFSEEMATEQYSFESMGRPKFNFSDRRPNGNFNGYAVGKHWMDVTISMWREDLDNGLLRRDELSNEFPEWFLQKMKI